MDRNDGAIVVAQGFISRKPRWEQLGSVKRGHGADSFPKPGQSGASTSSKVSQTRDWPRKGVALGSDLTAEAELSRLREARPRALSSDERNHLLALGADLAHVWHAATTTPRDRKELFRTLLEEVIVKVERDEAAARLTLRWKGGALAEIDLAPPRSRPATIRTDEDTIAPRHRRKRSRSQGPFLRRRYPASTVIRPCPTPARAAARSSVDGATTARNGSPPITQITLPTCRAHYPGGSRRALMSVASPSRAAFPVSQAGRHPHLHFRGLLRLHSCYGPSDCSTTQGGLSRGAPAQSVTRQSRPPATRSNRQLSGWYPPPLVIRAVGAH